MIALVLALASVVAEFLLIGWLCSLFSAAVFGYVQPAWVFAIGWFLLVTVIRLARGK